jgi:hemolysin activation/secretion protein
LRPVKIDGVNDNYYTALRYPAIRSRDKSLTWQIGFNYLDSTVTALDQSLYADYIRTLSLAGIYSFADRYAGANMVNAEFRQGLPILGYTSDTHSNMTSRFGGRGDFTKVSLQLSRLQAVKGAVSLYGILRGQYAFNPLLAAEQFTFGGNQLGRGYDVAEFIGDRGLAGSVEARYDWYIDKFFIKNMQLYAFYDMGKIWNIKGIPNQIKSQSGTSTGIGTRFFLTKLISGNIMYTQILTKQVAAEKLIHDGRRPRIFFSLVAALD